MPVTPIVLLGALVYAFTNFLRYLAGRQFSSALTMLVAWAAGIGAVFLFAGTQFGDQVHVGTVAVASFNLSTKLLVGFLASSLFAAFHDLKTAIDSTQSAAVPKLLRSKTSTPVHAPSVDPAAGLRHDPQDKIDWDAARRQFGSGEAETKKQRRPARVKR